MRCPFNRLRLPHRFTAVLGVVLVLALNVLAVLPAAHAWLHQPTTEATQPACKHHGCGSDSRAPADDDCAVVKFAHGHGGLAVAALVVEARACVLVTVLGSGDDLAVPAPAFRLPPGCGPPAV